MSPKTPSCTIGVKSDTHYVNIILLYILLLLGRNLLYGASVLWSFNASLNTVPQEFEMLARLCFRKVRRIGLGMQCN